MPWPAECTGWARRRWGSRRCGYTFGLTWYPPVNSWGVPDLQAEGRGSSPAGPHQSDRRPTVAQILVTRRYNLVPVGSKTQERQGFAPPSLEPQEPRRDFQNCVFHVEYGRTSGKGRVWAAMGNGDISRTNDSTMIPPWNKQPPVRDGPGALPCFGGMGDDYRRSVLCVPATQRENPRPASRKSGQQGSITVYLGWVLPLLPIPARTPAGKGGLR